MSALRSLIPYLAWSYMSLVGATTRLRWLGGEHIEGLRARKQRFILAFWHQRQVFFTWSHRGFGAAVLVSRSADGELIARTMELSRIAACRGSSSRGGMAGAREMIEAVEAGHDLGITPDGPRGPARQVKPGVIYLAQKLALPIVPISNALSRRLELRRSWDRFQVPLPFGRAVVAYGEPIRVDAGDDPAAKAGQLRAALERLTQDAEAALRGRP